MKISTSCTNFIFIILTALVVVKGVQANITENQIQERLKALEDDFSIEKAADFLMELKNYVEQSGCQSLPLSELCLKLPEILQSENIAIDHEFIQQLYEEILIREKVFAKSSFFVDSHQSFLIKKNKHKKQQKDIQVSSKFALGFVKFLSGGLLCIIPHPVTFSIGSQLVVKGIEEMMDHAGDECDDPYYGRKSQEFLDRQRKHKS